MDNKLTGKNVEDAIDIRAIVRKLLRYKWLIVGITILMVIAALLIDVFVLPPQYTTSATLGIQRPTFQADLEPSIDNPSAIDNLRTLGDITKSLPDLAEAADVWMSVCDKMDVQCTGEGHKRPEFQATIIGINQLKLTVTCADPQFATDFANYWADEVKLRWNLLYGNLSLNLISISEDVETAEKEWAEAQDALLSYLPDSKINVIEVELAQAKQNLDRLLTEINSISSLIRDAESLDNRLSNLPDDANISFGDSMSIIGLQQRSAGGVSGFLFQIQTPTPYGAGYTVSEARKDLSGFINALSTQNDQATSEIPAQEVVVNRLTKELESEQYEINKLEQKRDQAYNAYQVLAGYQIESEINVRYQQEAAYNLAPARVPTVESGQSTLIIVFLSAMIGFLGSVGGVLIYCWWKEDDAES